MARGRLRIDGRGIREVAKSLEMRAVIEELGEDVAANVRRLGIRVDGVPGQHELPVEAKTSTTDRARATVTLAHPAGLAVQAKHGALTRAAAQAGIEVRSR